MFGKSEINLVRRRILFAAPSLMLLPSACSAGAVGYLKPKVFSNFSTGERFGLDWHYCKARYAGLGSDFQWVHFRGIVDTGSLLGGDSESCLQPEVLPHLVLAVNCEGQAEHLVPQENASGERLFDRARGFYIGRGCNNVYGELWLGSNRFTAKRLVDDDLIRDEVTGPAELDTALQKRLWFDIKAGHRAGRYANTLTLELRENSSAGRLLIRSSLPWGWDSTASVRCVIGYIGAPDMLGSGYFNVRADLHV